MPFWISLCIKLMEILILIIINVYINRDGYFQFGLVFIKKNNQTEFKKKLKPVQTGRFRFGFLGQKPVHTSLARFFWFGSFFSGFFRFYAYKTETKPVGFCKILIDFFLRFGFFSYFFFLFFQFS